LHIASFNTDAVLVKSADVVCNMAETVADIEKEGDVVFERFNAPKEKFIAHYMNVAKALLEKMPGNPFREDFEAIASALKKFG